MIHDTGHVAHHTGNTLALIIPAAAFWAHVNPILTGVLSLAGLLWYGVLFYDRFTDNKKDPED